MENDIDKIEGAIYKSFNTLFSNFSSFFSRTNDKLAELTSGVDKLNKTIEKASDSSNRVAWALWGVTVAGVLIAAVQLFKK